MSIKINDLTNGLSRVSLYIFYTLVLIIFIVFINPWPEFLTVLEDILLFMPRWLIILPLLTSIFMSLSLIQKHRIPLVISVFYIISYYHNFNIPQLPLQKAVNAQNRINIMTANLGNTEEATLIITGQIKKHQLSVIALQETSEKQTKKIIPKGWGVQCDGHMCLASVYPVTFVESQSRQILGGWGNIAALFNITVNNEIISILNVHVETPRKGFETFTLSKFNFQTLVDNYDLRYLEASIIRDWTNGLGKKIILGDFNMPIESSIYKKFFFEFENTFNTSGVGLGYTKYTRIHGIRIDHILTDNNFQTIAAEVGNEFGGDHRPMIAKLAF